MKYRPLGKTGLNVSEISLGAARGAVDSPQDFVAAVHAAIEQGVNLIDTAQHYEGSEEKLGEALQSHDDVLVQTKYLPYESFAPEAKYTGSPKALIEAAQQSCKRLKRDHLDIFLGHGIRTLESCDRFMHDGCLDAMLKLKQQGVVRHIGISELSEADGQHAVLQKIIPTGKLDVVMLTINFMLQTAIQSVLPLCEKHGVGTVVMMPLNQASKASGLVNEEAAKECVRRHIAEGNLPDASPYTDDDLFGFLQPLSIPQAALQFVLAQNVSSCCVGARQASRIRQNIAFTQQGPQLTQAQMDKLRSLFGSIQMQVR